MNTPRNEWQATLQIIGVAHNCSEDNCRWRRVGKRVGGGYKTLLPWPSVAWHYVSPLWRCLHYTCRFPAQVAVMYLTVLFALWLCVTRTQGQGSKYCPPYNSCRYFPEFIHACYSPLFKSNCKVSVNAWTCLFTGYYSVYWYNLNFFWKCFKFSLKFFIVRVMFVCPCFTICQQRVFSR